MKPPDIPADEPLRLGTLRSLSILDTSTEDRFDRITRIAKRLFDVPIALVSLVDEDRQWFKSCVGLSVRETPRHTSFCGHAILGDGVFMIEDAAQDHRFADNPLVVGEPLIRFYAGCPLRAPNGQKLGTLCIIDRIPRSLTEEDRGALQDLAALAERELVATQLAMLDDLTNIANRRGFLAIGQASLKICRRQGIPASLAFFDLDDFKAINDNFGHVEGDRALATFAEYLSKACRDSDLAGRLGGDEFVVLLTNSSIQQSEEVIQRLIIAVDDYNQQVEKGYTIQFSYGIVAFEPQQHETVESLLADGDSLMYRIKRTKKSMRGPVNKPDPS